jgi:FlaA1/EpsC-like NDP-sugar epimerase
LFGEEQKMTTSKLFHSFRIRLLTLPRQAKQATMIAYDALSYWASAVISFWVVFGTTNFSTEVITISLLAMLIAMPIHFLHGLYTSIVRYTGLTLLVVGLRATFFVTAVLMAISSLSGFLSAPIRVGIVFWAFSLILVVGGRVAARMLLTRRNVDREPVIVYGAGGAGAQLVSALFEGDDYLPVAMVDANLALRGKRIHELKVYSPEETARLIEVTGARRILLAIPRASRRMRREVLEYLSEFPVRVMTIPDLKDIVLGKARLDDISDVDVKELLGRDPVPPDPELLGSCITGKNVLVTGAGGSIGSELCRQIVALSPVRLVLLELAEPALYRIERRLRRRLSRLGADCEIVPLLGSVHHKDRMREIMQAFNIDTVYHAAAYKHVPIVEQNLFEGIHNNVFGTLHCVQAAIEANIETFVLISTDKAVNPSSVMGATKRLAELVLQAYQHEEHDTRLCMVRFGNVLESSGSVVPVFKEQIRSGGPVTVTHRDIIRYFMTIPEASELVIQAGSMARGGDVFVLDMGKPVKIADLARRMINLMGMTVRDEENPDGDIEIQYTGLRPAEKLYEELLIGSNVAGTAHPRIMRADEDCLGMDELTASLNDLEAACEALDHARAREILLRSVDEYRPLNGIDDLVWLRKASSNNTSTTQSNRIVDFPKKPA